MIVEMEAAVYNDNSHAYYLPPEQHDVLMARVQTFKADPGVYIMY
jgi:hypothetical protein